MKTTRNWKFASLFGAAFLGATLAWAAQGIVVHRVQLAGTMGADNGHLVLAGDQLIFVDDTNPSGSFAIPKTDVRNLDLNNGILTITMSRPFTNMYGERSDVVLRVFDPSSPGLVADWLGMPITTMGEAARVNPGAPPVDATFDATHDGHHGQLIVSANGVSWQDLTDTNHSRSWNYSQIKELKRENGNTELEIKPYNGDNYKFRINGPFMNDTVYNLVANRIVTARH